jgi:hypothetical protein
VEEIFNLEGKNCFPPHDSRAGIVLKAQKEIAPHEDSRKLSLFWLRDDLMIVLLAQV